MKTLTKEKAESLGISKYVKRPIPAYAIQIVPDNLTVQTLEGQFNFGIGDYLIIGNDNEVWTVKEKIFEATYEQV